MHGLFGTAGREKENFFMLSDIEIAQNAEMYPIGKIAAELSISEEDIEYYGHYKAKLSEQLFQKLDSKPNGKLILVKGRRELGEMVVNEKTTYDTLSFVYMKGDSLALRNSAGVVTGYKRSKDARTVNAKANAAAAKLSEKLKQELR